LGPARSRTSSALRASGRGLLTCAQPGVPPELRAPGPAHPHSRKEVLPGFHKKCNRLAHKLRPRHLRPAPRLQGQGCPENQYRLRVTTRNIITRNLQHVCEQRVYMSWQPEGNPDGHFSMPLINQDINIIFGKNGNSLVRARRARHYFTSGPHEDPPGDPRAAAPSRGSGPPAGTGGPPVT